MHGGNGAGYVTGGAGHDDLYGGADNDRLWGNGGLDHLTGDAGADRFNFLNASGGLDTITDFSQAEGDKLVMDPSGFGGGLTAGALDPSRLVADGAVDQAFGQFLYKSATGRLIWDADGTGAGRGYLIAVVQNGGLALAGLTAGDFDITA